MQARELKAGVDLARVKDALGPVLSAHGVILADLEWLTDRAGWTLRLTIERLGEAAAAKGDGGVTLEDCANVSRDASQVLDVEDLIPQRYNLEVSSPGLERALKSRADFTRFEGRSAKVKLRAAAPDGQRVLRGAIDTAPDDSVAIIVDGKRIEVPFENVSEAHLVFELAPAPKAKAHKKSPKEKR